MACFHPLEAFKDSVGRVHVVGAAHKRRFQHLGDRVFVVPCGKCVGCRDVLSRSWAIRCMHEASLYKENMFVTLTYNEETCPVGLKYEDFQLFMRYFRRSIKPRKIRFFGCGEYGEITRREHFHVVIFNYRFPDAKKYDERQYSSAMLSALWPHGRALFGSVTMDSARYVAGYCAKRVSTGVIKDIWNTRLDPETGELVKVESEYGMMSLKPGIGYPWFEKYYKEVFYARDGICLPGGKTVPAPRFYYQKLLEFSEEKHEEIRLARMLSAKKFIQDCSPERLTVRERCLNARKAFNNRRSL